MIREIKILVFAFLLCLFFFGVTSSSGQILSNFTIDNKGLLFLITLLAQPTRLWIRNSYI